MTARVQAPAAPGPLEDYAARFDDLFSALGQRRGFREYPTGLPAPRERNKTLTCLTGAEPTAGINDPAVQRLQYFCVGIGVGPRGGQRPATGPAAG
ncbi:hypothetical protein AB0J63_42755 [Streptosporangium canum]